MSRIALDSNVLIYAAGVARSPADGAKIERSLRLLASLRREHVGIVPVQAIGELGIALLRAGTSREMTAEVARSTSRGFEIAASSWTAMDAALDLMQRYKLQLWDSLILAAAAEAGCSILLSEDMQAGFTWRSLTVLNPFAEPLDQRLSGLLG